MNKNKIISSAENDLRREHARIYTRLKSLQTDIDSVFPDEVPEDERYIEVRLQLIKNHPEVPGTLFIRSGSPDYDQDHRGYWSSGIIAVDTSIKELTNELKQELLDNLATQI
jgi:hypothetical protein